MRSCTRMTGVESSRKRGLVALERLDVGGDVGVDGERDVEEDDLLDARVRGGRLPGRKRREELLAQKVEVLAVCGKVPLGRQADALVHGADAQAVLDVGEVAPPVEEAEEVLALGALHAPDGGLVGEELARLSCDRSRS